MKPAWLATALRRHQRIEESRSHPSSHAAAARFSVDDPQDLIDLSFGCPFCGGQAGLPQFQSRHWESTQAHCRCTSCEQTWILELDLAQLRRIYSYMWPRAER